jgi:hypothetical protein
VKRRLAFPRLADTITNIQDSDVFLFSLCLGTFDKALIRLSSAAQHLAPKPLSNMIEEGHGKLM